MSAATLPVSAFLDAAGARVHYLDWRSDLPPLLIVHGNTHAGGVYSPLAQRLSADFRVVAVDLRAHGLSRAPNDFSWPSMRDDVTALIDHLRLDKLLVVAHSRGGGVSMLATCARRERIRGLVVYEPTVPLRLIDPNIAPAKEQEWLDTRLTRTVGRRSSFPSREDAYRHYRNRGSFKAWEDEYLQAFVAHGVVDKPDGGCELASDPAVEAQLVRTRPSTLGWEGLTPCSVPVLALYGRDSGRLDSAYNDSREAVRRLFPQTRVQIMENATHSGPMEQPEAFEALVRGFSAQLRTSAP